MAPMSPERTKLTTTSPAPSQGTQVTRTLNALLRPWGGTSRSRAQSSYSGPAGATSSAIPGLASKPTSAVDKLSNLLGQHGAVGSSASSFSPTTRALCVVDALFPISDAKTVTTTVKRLVRTLQIDATADPEEVWTRCKALVDAHQSPEVQNAGVELLKHCVLVSNTINGDISTAAGRHLYYESVRKAFAQADHVDTATKGGRAFTESELQSFVGVLDALTCGGKYILGFDGLMDLLSDISYRIHRLRQIERLKYIENLESASAPLLDPEGNTPFVRLPPNTFYMSFDTSHSAAALLTAMTRLSFAHIDTKELRSVFANRIRGVLASLGELEVSICLELVDWVIKTGIIPPEHLEDVVKFVARVSGLEGRCRVVEISPDNGRRIINLPSRLPDQANSVMRLLLRSPVNQALKHLRAILSTMPKVEGKVRPVCPVPLLVGALRCLRRAYKDYETDAVNNNQTLHGENNEGYPTLFSLGLLVVYDNLTDVLRWRNADVDSEVLLFLEERIAAQTHGFITLSFQEWDMVITMVTSLLWHVEAWELSNGISWSISSVGQAPTRHTPMSTMKGDAVPAVVAVSSAPTLETTSQAINLPVLSSLSLVLERMLAVQIEDAFKGSHLQFYDFLLSTAKHLNSSAVASCFAFYKERMLISPGRADWLERLEKVISIFFPKTPYADIHEVLRSGRQGVVQLLQLAYGAAQGYESHMNALVDRILLPFFEDSLSSEEDPIVIRSSLAILQDCVKDNLVFSSDTDPAAMQRLDMMFDILCRLSWNSCEARPTSVLLAKSDKADNATPKSVIRLVGISLSSTETLILLFYHCIVVGGRRTSLFSVRIFQHLLDLLVPSGHQQHLSSVHTGNHGDGRLAPVTTRLAVLQCLTRLRADQSHRIWSREHLDMLQLAVIVGKAASLSNGLPEPAHIGDSAEASPRGRSDARQDRATIEGSDSASRATPSAGRSQTRSRTRQSANSPSRKRPRHAVPAVVHLWQCPDALLYDFPSHAVRSSGNIGLVSFDRELMQGWSEEMTQGEEDVSLLNAEGADGSPVVLPVSQYLDVINNCLSYETNWDLVSYILCALPNQLCNKHFLSGPNTARKLLDMHSLLCKHLIADSLCQQVVVPPAVRRSDVHAVAYQWLSTLIAYRHLLTREKQNEMVRTFISGLSKTPNIAKPSVHALTMACYEFESSVSTHLPVILSTLTQILSMAGLAVHILELVASIGHIKALYENFAEEDYRKVFAVAVQYLASHYEDPTSKTVPTEQDLALEHAFKQYVLTLSYYIIALWYSIVPLAERPKYLGFIVPRMISANDSLPELDPSTVVSLDMLARLAYSQPVAFAAEKMDDSAPAGMYSRSWICGNSVLSVDGLEGKSNMTLTIRRPSGILKRQVPVGNESWSELEILPLILKHRDMLQTERRHLVEILEESAEDAVFVADPAFFSMFLPPCSHINTHGLPRPLPVHDITRRTLLLMDRMSWVDFHKIGVLYVGPNQSGQHDILSNVHGSKAYMSFLNDIGTLRRLKGGQEYAGGLDRERDTDGKWYYTWSDQIQEVVFHVATLMPTRIEEDPQCNDKKRHIGNDYVKVFYNDSGRPIPLDVLPGQFNFVNIIIEPHTPAGEAGRGSMGNDGNTQFFRVSMDKRSDMPELGPLGAFKMVSTASVASVVRELALHANVFAQLFLQSVGVEGKGSSHRRKIEYASTWCTRLDAIHRLERIDEMIANMEAAKRR